MTVDTPSRSGSRTNRLTSIASVKNGRAFWGSNVLEPDRISYGVPKPLAKFLRDPGSGHARRQSPRFKNENLLVSGKSRIEEGSGDAGCFSCTRRSREHQCGFFSQDRDDLPKMGINWKKFHKNFELRVTDDEL
jgi:hypothetical protein